MKKVVFVAICVLGIICFSSCRSTSKSCGLADAETTTQTTLKQADLI
ncbi:hypothetical protein H9W90_05255 [Polaribacter pectinis]|uniref:Uncharacterized protein n=1 Tax=Polaribacter pectinis TaxID=2738844 RepID=A0A7G9LD28_9FLAO|nr:hypothetical protein [Polaribacter pectinis]QNM86527.1 hypothetical protein H9W90_05255 [Polaribacter pectinis]